jgi:hypothetical protein
MRFIYKYFSNDLMRTVLFYKFENQNQRVYYYIFVFILKFILMIGVNNAQPLFK